MFNRNVMKIYFDGSEDTDKVQRITRYLQRYYSDHIKEIKVPRNYRK